MSAGPIVTRSSPRVPRILGGNRRWMLASLIAIGLGQAAAAVATALLVEAAFEGMIGDLRPPTRAEAVRYGGGLLLAVVVGSVFRGLERIQAERLGQGYAYRVRLALYDRLVTLAPRSLQRRSQGAVALRFVGDVTALRQWVSLGLARIAVGGTLILGALGALAVINLRIATGLAMVLLLGGAATFVLGGPLKRRARVTRRSRARLAANVGQQVNAIGVVQAFGQGGRERKRIARQGRDLRDASVARARVAGVIQGATEATGGLATGLVLLLGASEVAAGRADAGTVVASLAIVGVLVAPLRDLGRAWEYRQNASIARERLAEFLASPSVVNEMVDAPDLTAGPGRLEFDGVSVAGSLRDVSATAAAGARVAIVGPNGAGKSTLLHVASRLIDPEAGRVLLDGEDVRERSLASLHEAVAIAGADMPLLRGSLSRNLRYRRPNASQEDLDRVWRMCGVDALLAELPEGDDTRVAEDGKGLSAGQRARVSLARAVLGEPRVLLLDEADAHLDPRAAEAIDQVLAEFGGTVLLVTHRPERLAAMDAVWYLAGGELLEAGAPDELLRPGRATARLFGGEEERRTA